MGLHVIGARLHVDVVSVRIVRQKQDATTYSKINEACEGATDMNRIVTVSPVNDGSVEYVVAIAAPHFVAGEDLVVVVTANDVQARLLKDAVSLRVAAKAYD